MESPSSLTRALVDRLAADAAAVELDAIRASVQACDYDTAAARVIARRVRGLATSLADVADVLPGLDDLAPMAWLVALTEGDRPAVLLDLVAHQRFAGDDVGADQEALALFAALRLGDRETLRPLIAPRVRLTARWQTTPEGTTLLAALVRELDDARLSAALPTLAAKEDAALTRELAALLELSLDSVLALLPRDAATVRSASGFTVRAAQKPGRNDVCPCGSGKKYKKCHGAKDEGVAVASPVAGLSWEEYLRTASEKLTEDEVQRLALRDLGRVDLGRLRNGPLVAASRRFAVRRRWDLAANAIDALASRDVSAKDVDDRRAELLLSALAHGEVAFARTQGEKLHDRSVVPQASWLEIEIGESTSGILDHVDAQAAIALRSDDPGFALDLAHTLLARVPALGIFVGRGALTTGEGRSTRDLLDAIEDARAELHVPPGDIAYDFVASVDRATARDEEILAAETATKKVADQAAQLRVDLREAASRISSLERELGELKELQTSPAPQPIVEGERDDGERRALRVRVEELKALIKEGNAERQELRARLTAVVPARVEAPAVREEEDDDADDVADAKRGVVIPRLAKRVEEVLPEVPQTVAAEALRTIGALAAGDEAAWTRVKQAKDMPRQVLMARLGIHYRLLFRVDAGMLDVLELVPRESLDGALKRLRSA